MENIQSANINSIAQNIQFVSHKIEKPTKFVFFQNHSIKLTDKTIKKIELLKQENPNNIIRIIINGGGCQGFQYEFKTDFIENIGKKTRDIVLHDENNNLLFVFDLFSEFYIKGSTINHISTLLESGFKIEKNPQSQSVCGCNKSFASNDVFEGDD